MNELLLPLLIAGAVAMAVLGLWQIVARLTDSERRRIKQRLSAENRPDSAAAVARSITTQSAQPEGFSATLTRIEILESLSRRVAQAYPDVKFANFIGLTAGIALGAFALTFLLSASLIVATVAGALGCSGPLLILGNKRSRRQRQLADQLPEALDFLSRVLRAGHSFSTGLQMMGQELPQPLAGEFRRAYDQHSLGVSIEDAMREMATRIDSTDFAFFVTAVLIQRQTGGDLAEVLDNISGMIRQRIRLQDHVKAKTAEGRFTGYLLSAFPAVMFVIAYLLNPDYAGVLVKTHTGLVLLGVAFGMQILGLIAIRKITTVEV